MSLPLKLVKGKIVELTFNYDVFIQREVASSFVGRSIKCTRDLAEAGMCGGCSYSRNVPSDNFDKTSPVKVSELGLVVRVGNNAMTIIGLTPVLVSENEFTIKLDAKNFEMANELEIHIDPFSLASVDKMTSGYNYTDTCQGRRESAGISLQRRVEANVLMKVSGRGYEILKNIL
ncbi:MAG: hypothetical protein H7336_08370 [Bacteriovorax sp.]|nr:hypothetical protein [Bacteriovorax sp.]